MRTWRGTFTVLIFLSMSYLLSMSVSTVYEVHGWIVYPVAAPTGLFWLWAHAKIIQWIYDALGVD